VTMPDRARLDYGTEGLTVSVPPDTTVIAPAHARAVTDEIGAVVAALERPVSGRPLRDLVPRGATVAIAVCDATRPQPREPMLQAIARTLDGTVRPEDVVVIIATGTHTRSTDAQRRELLGEDVLGRWRVIDHDAHDAAALLSLGTIDGVPVWLNRAWVEADVRITTGLVEPHFFAGFSGGPKMVAPGLAGLETVLELHSPARIADPRATFGVLRGNPVHDPVRAIAATTGVTFAVDALIDDRHRITHVYGGPVLDMHAAACETARQIAMCRVEAPFDVVVTTNGGYPLDRNLYQSVKGMAAAAMITAESGTIICAAECRDGLPDGSPYARMLRGSPTIAEAAQRLMESEETVPDGWQVQVQARVQARARVALHSALPDAAVRDAHLEPVDDIGALLADLRRRAQGTRVCVLPNGPQTIPYISPS
jgi:nickel-dependent lactate racemase